VSEPLEHRCMSHPLGPSERASLRAAQSAFRGGDVRHVGDDDGRVVFEPVRKLVVRRLHHVAVLAPGCPHLSYTPRSRHGTTWRVQPAFGERKVGNAACWGNSMHTTAWWRTAVGARAPWLLISETMPSSLHLPPLLISQCWASHHRDAPALVNEQAAGGCPSGQDDAGPNRH